ncbi:unnamed protein product [Pleuronectes platessa]|uniref:Secreted protein n=1 Tax=Pleuronectes platessa TaxID=8262 RepID=A0A9N7UHN6_PLEPL|nr:unnamed protein product [Pleuronectes platessa]
MCSEGVLLLLLLSDSLKKGGATLTSPSQDRNANRRRSRDFIRLQLLLGSERCIKAVPRKSPCKPLAELDHRSPAVHSQGPLLLLAVSRPTWSGGERRKEWVAGGGGGGARGQGGGHRFPSC